MDVFKLRGIRDKKMFEYIGQMGRNAVVCRLGTAAGGLNRSADVRHHSTTPQSHAQTYNKQHGKLPATDHFQQCSCQWYNEDISSSMLLRH